MVVDLEDIDLGLTPDQSLIEPQTLDGRWIVEHPEVLPVDVSRLRGAG